MIIEKLGVSYLGWTLAKRLKNSPSFAIANSRRGWNIMQELNDPKITIIAVIATNVEATLEKPGIYLTASETAALEWISLSNGINPVTQTASNVYKPSTMNTELRRAFGSTFPGFLNSPAMKQIAAIPV